MNHSIMVKFIFTLVHSIQEKNLNLKIFILLIDLDLYKFQTIVIWITTE